MAKAERKPTHKDLRDAAGRVADAIKSTGVDQWPRFVTDASERAGDPMTVAAVEKSKQVDPARDAIRPVYPIETALELGAAGLGGGAAAVRAVGDAILRQILSPRAASKLDGKTVSAASLRDKSTRYTVNLEHPIGASKALSF